MRVLEPSKLELIHTITQRQLKLPLGTGQDMILGLSSLNENLLIFADLHERKVKSCTEKSEVTVLFQETDPDWLVSNVLMLDAEKARKLAVTEVKVKKESEETSTRLVICGQIEGGLFKSEQILPMEEKASVYSYFQCITSLNGADKY